MRLTAPAPSTIEMDKLMHPIKNVKSVFGIDELELPLWVPHYEIKIQIKS